MLDHLSRLKGVSSVICQRISFNASSGTAVYVITFIEYPIKPYENNLFQHDGNPQISFFHCNSTRMDYEDAIEPYCEVSYHNSVFKNCKGEFRFLKMVLLHFIFYDDLKMIRTRY